MNILMLNMSRWSDWQNGIVNRNFHIAKTLREQSRVKRMLLVDFLPYNSRKTIRSFLSTGFDHIEKLSWPNTFRYSTSLSFLMPRRTIQRIRSLLHALHMDSDCAIWSYHPFFPHLTKFLPHELSVFDAVDDWSSHYNYRSEKQKLQKNYKDIEKTFDLVFTVSEMLKQRLFPRHPHAVCVPNGIDLNHFYPQSHDFPPCRNLKRPIIGYVGIIQSRFDSRSAFIMAKAHPDKTFAYVGPIWPDAQIKQCLSCPNIIFLGRIPYQDIPLFLSSCDCAVIPHIVNDLTLSMDPLKVYEYLAMGLPVIAPEIFIHPALKRYVLRAKSSKDFPRLIPSALAMKNSDFYHPCRNQLRQFTWEKRVQTMLSMIDSAQT